MYECDGRNEVGGGVLDANARSGVEDEGGFVQHKIFVLCLTEERCHRGAKCGGAGYCWNEGLKKCWNKTGRRWGA